MNFLLQRKMGKGSKLKLLKFPTFFTSSCKSQNLDEVIDHNKNSIFTPQKPIFLPTPLMEEILDDEKNEENEKYPFHYSVIKPKPIISFHQQSSTSSSSMMRKPRCPTTFDQMVRENCIVSDGGNHFNRRKVVGKYSLLSPSGDFYGRRCPPNKKKKNKGKTTHFGNNYYGMKNGLKSSPFILSSSNNESDDNGDFFSSDDEREDYERQTMFSLKSMSFSSDSDDLVYQTRTRTRARRRKTGWRPKEVGVMSLEGKVQDTFAVVKSSSDPYNDFRTSMVEMIIEKQIFGAKELEQLLKCFLSLNSSHHHVVIVQVFKEICDALFSHCS